MEQIYKNKLNMLGYTQLVCDIFPKWEDVKDEILIPERKSGTGNGTIHVFLGAADNDLQKEFSTYYRAVNNGEDPSVGAIEIKHFFLASNVLSMLGYVCQYYYSKGVDPNDQVKAILSLLSSYPSENGLLQTSSLFKLSIGSSRLRPYFKQFDGNGVFTKLIRQLLLPNSGYKISLYKNGNGEYAAFWLIGFDWQTDFEANSNKDFLSKKNTRENDKSSLQQIFYGAPGTGKSDEVDDVCSKYPHHRITFHPDTDYSAFVGCYKPKTHKKNMLAGNGINETQLLSSFFDSNSSKYSGKNKARYLYEALVHTKDIRDLRLDAQTIADKLKAQNFSGCAYTTEATCMYNIYDWLKEDGYVVENKISYEFTPQCFIKAYVDAWKNQKEGKPVFLVIEEINRGNCAQIFGDLFQLLDRDKNGFSRYEISPDTDLQEYIAEIGLNISGVTDHEGKDISALIASGELMKLPNNLYIWATMNTSDQSLFPIDSAFKRRWDWKYIKIKKGIDKNNGKELDWKIKVGEDNSYDWWEFVNRINDKIAKMTSSADKQLGYFFCLADEKGEIGADTFVNKVAFYLWNDVFKDYAEDGSPLLKYKKKEEDKSESDLTFPDFFDQSGEIDKNVVKQFIEKVMKEDDMDKPAE